jgi:hypothetical protein
MSQRRSYVVNDSLFLLKSNRGKWSPDMAAISDYLYGQIRMFRPFEDLFISSTIETNVRIDWPLIQPEEVQHIDPELSLDTYIPLGQVMGPEVSMEDIEDGTFQENLRPQLSYERPVSLTPIPRTFIPRTSAPSMPPHIVRILLEKAAADRITCPITGDLITPANGTVTPCGHLFEKTALNAWMARSATCPDCRHKI